MEGLSLPSRANCPVEIEPVLPTEPDSFKPDLPAALSIVADGVVANHLAVTATLVTLKSTVHVISTLVQKDALRLGTVGDSGIEVTKDPLQLDSIEPGASDSASIVLQVDQDSVDVPQTVYQPPGIRDPQLSLYSLHQTCARILSDPGLSEAHVATFRCFGQIAMGVVHRFVVLELSHEQATHKWLRFDRRPDRSIPLAKIVASGAPANDSTVFGATIGDVLGDHSTTLECQFRLKKHVQLRSLVPFFHIFMQTVPRYRFWRENCWFLSSLIAGLLVRLGDGVFEFGRLVYPNIAPELRRYLYLRYLVETNASLDSLTELEQVESLLIKYHPGKKDGAALIRLKSGALMHDSTLNVAGMTISSVRERFTICCRRFLREVLHLPRPAHSRKTIGFAKILASVAGDAFMDDLHSTARSASSEAVMILRSLLSHSSHIEVIKSTSLLVFRKPKRIKKSQGHQDPQPIHEDDELLIALAEAYNGLGDAQKAMEQWDMAERAYENGVRVLRVLYSRRPTEFLKPLCLQLSGLAMTQLAMGKIAESAISRSESIMLRREVCVESVRARSRESMNRSLGPTPPPDTPAGSQFEQCLTFCKSLYREARGVHIVDQECIRIRRLLHQDNDALHREHLSRTLLAHARSLRHLFLAQAEHPNSSPSESGRGSVMNTEEPLLEIEDLVRALTQQGWTLAVLRRYSDAAEAFGEAVKISQVLQSRDPSGVGAQNLPYSLCAWGDTLYSSHRPSEAASAIGESVSLARHRHKGSSFLANLLASYCRALRATGRLDESEAAGVESTELWEGVWNTDPLGNYGCKIAFSNFALTITLIYRKDFDRALVTARRACKALSYLIEVEFSVPQSLHDLTSIMEVLDSSGKRLPGSLWVTDNMRGELEELDRAVAGIGSK